MESLMPRSFAAILVMALVLSAPLSAQSDTIPSMAADTARPTPGGAAPASASNLRSGQWAARFTMSGGFYGIGALLFTSPHAAWAIRAEARATDDEQADVRYEQQSAMISVGRRWYGAERSRVRPLGGIGIQANYSRYANTYYGNEQASESYLAGIYGELGAAIFFAPELSLGATWGANIYKGLTDYDDRTQSGFSAGYMSIEGVFYF
jgi:hypothetical protein